MKVTECMKKALGLPEWVVSIVRSNGYPWNGWIEDENGFAEFRAGIFWQALEHIQTCQKCREACGFSLERVVQFLKEIEEEWNSVTNY